LHALARKQSFVQAAAGAPAPYVRKRTPVNLDARITGWLYEASTNQILSGVVRSRNIYRCGCDLRNFPTITFSCNSAIGTQTRTPLVRPRTASPAFATR